MRITSASLAMVVALVGCNKVTPTCRSLCRKITRCDEIEAADYITTEECRDLCEIQEAYYDSLEDDEETVTDFEAWNSYKWCTVTETCENLADGACYDEDLFAF